MHLEESEEAALAGEHGEIMQMAYRILAATGGASDAERLIPIRWAHLSGVNYNTIGGAGEEFLRSISSRGAKVRVRTTLNPMGFDADSVERYGLGDEFVSGQASIADSYGAMGVTQSFSCIPYEIFEMPRGEQIAFAESNAAIYANSFAGARTNKESAFSALASAITGKSPYSDLRREGEGATSNVTVRMSAKEPDELTYGMLGYFAGREAGGASSVDISGVSASAMDRRQCKAMCGGMGTSGTCAKFRFVEEGDRDARGSGGGSPETVEFDDDAARKVRDELDTAENGDVIALGSPQLGLWEMSDLLERLRGRSFKKRCMVFCPRAVKEQARKLDYVRGLERAGCEVLADCCTCLSPLLGSDKVDAVTTNSIKGAFYMNNASGVGVDLKPLAKILEDETE
ncbi:MAG: aconitase X catalytic domain-containing protein [Thaumarchaeota archaeon]|nr:aconitase X catalytic domain-containing protein [Nitrososphaerota archaeon]MDE0525364.1 aconitase X catalytic domain-containing protein [Nitrososphaerota archaeon]